ncbi:HAD family hydrolase [Alicyclobacillus fastidiosus]|uniref:HAD family hydrolase n=1 Tax=Alicyclobacillus fastidiosus TaxID=392011 RepID=A0ABV5AIG7_9BACL|nr:HAD family hydrolase [Alicyclobacillus fastidiosus]WEH10132.1 HAD family hydrolase [Alicyclobacillus fastidiosus]
MNAIPLGQSALLLAPCELFVFDFDGTVYSETDHFLTYGEEVAHFVEDAKRPAFLAELFDAFHRHLYRSSAYGISDAGDTDYTRRDASGIDDLWSVIGALATQFGVHREDLQKAFAATREWMASSAYHMKPIPLLRESILSLRAAGSRVVMATNSPRLHTEDMLLKLTLHDVFDEIVFDAHKPQGATDQFEGWLAKFQVDAARAVSIGDHFRNEIEPALALGMQTVYIDRHSRREPSPGVTVHLASPDELAQLFHTIASLHEC